MAVLERFAHGGGHVAQLLKKHQAKLANLPEVGADGGSPRWEYLRRFAADDFDPSNVDAYMAVAKTLGYKPAPYSAACRSHPLIDDCRREPERRRTNGEP